MIVETAKLDAMQYRVQYELIRSQVLGTVGSAVQGSTAGQTVLSHSRRVFRVQESW